MLSGQGPRLCLRKNVRYYSFFQGGQTELGAEPSGSMWDRAHQLWSPGQRQPLEQSHVQSSREHRAKTTGRNGGGDGRGARPQEPGRERRGASSVGPASAGRHPSVALWNMCRAILLRNPSYNRGHELVPGKVIVSGSVPILEESNKCLVTIHSFAVSVLFLNL